MRQRNLLETGIRKLIERALPEHTTEGNPANLEIFPALLSDTPRHKDKTYDGILSLLENQEQQGLLLQWFPTKQILQYRNCAKGIFPGLFDFSIGENGK